MTRAVLTLGRNFTELKSEAEELILKYFHSVCTKFQDKESFSEQDIFFPLLFSFQGFLDALAYQAPNISYPVLDKMMLKFVEIFNTDTLLNIETTVARFSVVPSVPSQNNVHVIPTQEGDNTDTFANNPDQTPPPGIVQDELTPAPVPQQFINDMLGEVDSQWQYYVFVYIKNGLQLGAILINYYICNFAKSICAKIIDFKPYVPPDHKKRGMGEVRLLKKSLLNNFLKSESPKPLDPACLSLLKLVAEFSISQISSLDEGADYIELASPERVELAYNTKSSDLDILGIAVVYKVIDSEIATNVVKSSILHEHGMSTPHLSLTIFKLAAVLCSVDEEIASVMMKYFPHFISLPNVDTSLTKKCAKVLVYGLRLISQDIIVSIIYTLVNMVSITKDAPSHANTLNTINEKPNGKSAARHRFEFHEKTEEEEANYSIYFNAIAAIVAISTTYDDPQITSLAATVLNQKFASTSYELNREVALGIARLAPYVPNKEFLQILRNLQAFATRSFEYNDAVLRKNIQTAFCLLSKLLTVDHPLYDAYLSQLLDFIVERGDVQELEHHRPHVEISATANEIEFYLAPLATLLPKAPQPPYKTTNTKISSLFRNTWFNMVVHGFSQTSELTSKNKRELEIIARSTPPLVSADSANKIESDLELNTVLQRGSSHRNVDNQKEIMDSLSSSHVFDFKTLQYPKLMFLAASVLLECSRVNTGNCSRILLYFGDPGMRSGDTNRYMRYISNKVAHNYVRNVMIGGSSMFVISEVAHQLKEMLTLCCHRVKAIQDQAFAQCDFLVKSVPSSLCSETSLFTLLDLLTLLWKSCLEAETDEYEPRSIFTAAKSGVRIELSDSYQQRQENLQRFHQKAREWVTQALAIVPYDVKSILTSYMADMEISGLAADSVALGFTFALEMGGSVTPRDRELVALDNSALTSLKTDTSAGFLSQYIWKREFHSAVTSDVISRVSPNDYYDQAAIHFRRSLDELLSRITQQGHYAKPKFQDVQTLLFKSSAYLSHPTEGQSIAVLSVHIPMKTFTEASIKFGVSLWSWAINEHPHLKGIIISELTQMWEWSVKARLGVYSRKHDLVDPAFVKMEYAPTNKAEINHEATIAAREFSCHNMLIRFLASLFQAVALESRNYVKMFSRMLLVGLQGLIHASLHPLAKGCRFELVRFALDVLDIHARMSARIASPLKHLIISSALTWFAQPAQWPFGGNRLKLRAELELLTDIAIACKTMVLNDGVGANANSTSLLNKKRNLLLLFLKDELVKMHAWSDPLQTGPDFYEYIGRKILVNDISSSSAIDDAWAIDPTLAIFLAERSKRVDLKTRVETLVAAQPLKVCHIPTALRYFLDGCQKHSSKSLHCILYWTPVSPIESINLFLPRNEKGEGNSLLLQYAMRSLESHDVNVTFFYVPQLVQMLRFDSYGYVEQFILETAKISQLFAHQIIWNIKANLFTGEDAPLDGPEDPINPTLERVVKRMIANFSDDDRDFYNREFTFFNTVTSISKSLMPLVKKTKAEKKAKIDEEIAKIVVDVGVYLPSNPDGNVVDIDRKSGRPLQSHAKTPFMATFDIERQVRDYSEDNDSILNSTTKKIENKANGNKTRDLRNSLEKFSISEDNNKSNGQLSTTEKQQQQLSEDEDDVHMKTIRISQGAIFKVGDDCRQDVMALQLISVFRAIFNNYALDLYVFPYRVTATAPGCGVIDVLPNSISRDMLGREAVNGLYEYFTSKFGGEDSILFQQARNNFVKSLAAYSVISYLIQFKDRHNGNIMYDEKGHVLHIDFGFCFDIVPGGVKFEAAPFKLTHEMVQVMGGSKTTQLYKWFEELSVKAFLACRPHAETIIQNVVPMLSSGLPCFKSDGGTIKRLRGRFVLEKTEREAAAYMRGLINQSYQSIFTKGYDEFQRITNGIPY